MDPRHALSMEVLRQVGGECTGWELEEYCDQLIALVGGDAWIEAGDVINKLHEDDADAVYRRVQFYTESIAASGGRSRP